MLKLNQSLLHVLKKSGIYISREKLSTREQFAQDIENEILKKSSGIIHLGAHLGQESERYSNFKIPVIWVEAIPTVYLKLMENISKFNNQKAICALLGDKNNIEVKFNLASNNYASSSIFTFGNEVRFKKLKMNSQMPLQMLRLDSIFSQDDLKIYEHWVVDVQGAELLVLKGAGNTFNNCKSLMIEVSTRQVYQEGVLWSELESFLSNFNLMPLWQPQQKSHENILFVKTSFSSQKNKF